MTASPTVAGAEDASGTTAYRLFWLAVLFSVLAFVVAAGICAPAVTGALDLYLRAHTP